MKTIETKDPVTKKLNEIEKIHELFQHSFEQSARSIAQIVGRDMKVSEFTLHFISSEHFVNQIEYDLDGLYFASVMKISNLLDTHIVLLISEQEGRSIYNSIIHEGETCEQKITSEMTRNIGELNNIMGSAFINCLADSLHQTIHNTVPVNTFDMLGAIVQSIVMQEDIIEKEILIADATMHEMNQQTFHVRLVILAEKKQLLELMTRL